MSDSITIAYNIERRMAQLGMTANAASVAAGLPRDAIRDILSGKSQNPRADTIMKIARALRVDPTYLLLGSKEGKTKDTPRVEEVILPVRYTVAAGAWKEEPDYADESPAFHSVPPAKGLEHYPQWLESVEGDSMDKVIPAGSLVHVVDAIAMHYQPADGDVVVVERTRAQGALRERSLKQLKLERDGQLWLVPRSHNARWKDALTLAPAETSDDVTVQVVGLVIRALIDFR